MARRNKWFHLLKRLFGSDVDSKYEKKAKRKRWVFAKSKSKCLPALPGLSLQRSRSLGDAEHEQSKRAVAVAAATTSAVEAAVAAAQAAAEVGRITGSPLSYPRAQKVAAIKIQTAFRGYLAKSALKALKGLVKLQALIRGQIVRQQMENTLKGLQSLMKIQSQTCASRARALVDCQVEDYENITLRKTNNSEVMKITDRRRPATPLSTKSDHPDVVEDRRLSWLDEWVGGQPSDKDIPEIFLTPCRDYNTKGKLEDSKLRSFNQSQRASTEDDDSFTSSPSFPSYMATTASAKAKSRSLSTPRQRLRSTDSCSDYGVPTTNRLLSPLSSVASDTGFTRKVRTWGSPQHKSRSGPLKCRHSSDHLPIDWDRHGAFR